MSVVYVSKKSSNSHARYKMLYDSVREQGESMLVIFPSLAKRYDGGPVNPHVLPPPPPNLPIVFHDLLYIDQPVGFVQVMENMESHASCSLSSPPN